MSIAANNASQSAIDSARRNEAVAQQGYQQRASAVFNQNLPNNSAQKAQADIAQGQAERQNAFSQLRNLTQTQSASKVQPGTPEALAAARTSSAGNTFSTNANAAQSRIGGYGDWATALNVANQGANNQLGVINNEAQHNAALLPLEITAASHKGDSLASWGRIIGALGTVVGGAGGGSGAGSLSSTAGEF